MKINFLSVRSHHLGFWLRLAVLMLLAVITTLTAGDAYPLRDAVEFHARGGLPNVLAKLKEGKEVRIAYFGGSITAANGWRVKTLAWFKKQYPQATISEINAAIGGTGSDLGVYRLNYDVLRHKPDLMFVEFAVNDGGAQPEQIQRCMEGIIRQTWSADPTTDICYVYTLTGDNLKDLQSGKYQRSASAMEALADHYDIPSIHFGVEVGRLEKEGKLVFKVAKTATAEERKAFAEKIIFSNDNVHPLDAGHEIYAQVVARNLATLTAAAVTPHLLKSPLVANNYQQAKMLPLDKATLSAGWQKLDPATDPRAKSFGIHMPSLFKASKPGETLSFSFKGTAVGIYDLLGPDCGQLKIVIDGGPAKTVARIDGYCTYHRIAHLTLGSGMEDKVHTVSIELDAMKPDKTKILFADNRPDMEKNPAKYEGANWYAGAIMLIGELVP